MAVWRQPMWSGAEEIGSVIATLEALQRSREKLLLAWDNEFPQLNLDRKLGCF